MRVRFRYSSRRVRRRDVPLLLLASHRGNIATRHREKKKLAEFANGSLLGNDSRIFVQHLGANPLSRTHPPLALSPSLLPLISLFQSSSIPKTPAYFIPSLSTPLFLRSVSFVLRLPPPRRFVFSYPYFRFPLLHRPDFCSNNVSIIMPLYTPLFLFYFCFFFSHYCYFFPLAISLHSFSCLSRHFAHPLCPLFLASLTFLTRRADIVQIKPFVPRSGCRPRFCYASRSTFRIDIVRVRIFDPVSASAIYSFYARLRPLRPPTLATVFSLSPPLLSLSHRCVAALLPLFLNQ